MTSNNQTGLDNLYRTALAQDSKISDLQQIVAVDREQLKFVTSNLRGLDSLLTTMTELELNVNTNTELLSATPGIATGGKALILHSSGDVTIGGDLKIKTLSTPVIGKITPIYARGTGFNNHSNRLVHIGDTTVLNDNVRGLTLIIINAETHAEVSTTNYDTFLGSTWGDALATAIEGLGDDQIGLIVSCDAWEASYFSMGTNLKVAALRVGLPRLAAMTEYITNGRHPYAAIFYGSGSTTLPGNQAIEIIKSHGGDAAYATLSTFLVNDSFIGQVPASALYHPSGDIRNGAYYLPEPIVYINEDGRVGIGTTSPQSFLHVAGNTYLDGNVTMTENLTVSGDVTITGNLTNDSITPKYLPARMYNFYEANVNIDTPGQLFTKWMISATDDTSGSTDEGSQIATLASIGLLGSGVKALTYGNTSYPASESTLYAASINAVSQLQQIGAHCTESYEILIAGYYRFTCSMAFISTTHRTNIIIHFAKKLYNTTDWIRFGPAGQSAYAYNPVHGHDETSSHINDVTWCDVGDNVGVWTMREARAGTVSTPISTSSFTAELLSVMPSHAIDDTDAWPGP
tara:strand:+ start:13946 stop:15667 length:1722 start_codon:yes stop_codon:yes gene_type:complete